MKNTIRLTESELTILIERIVSENEHHEYAKMNHGEFMNEIDSLCEEASMIEDANCSEINDMEHKWNLLDRSHNSHGVDRSDEFMLCGAKIRRFKKNRCTPRETGRSSMEDRVFKPRKYDRLSESVIITESDLTRILRRVISEQNNQLTTMGYSQINPDNIMNTKLKDQVNKLLSKYNGYSYYENNSKGIKLISNGTDLYFIIAPEGVRSLGPHTIDSMRKNL